MIIALRVPELYHGRAHVSVWITLYSYQYVSKLRRRSAGVSSSQKAGPTHHAHSHEDWKVKSQTVSRLSKAKTSILYGGQGRYEYGKPIRT